MTELENQDFAIPRKWLLILQNGRLLGEQNIPTMPLYNPSDYSLIPKGNVPLQCEDLAVAIELNNHTKNH